MLSGPAAKAASITPNGALFIPLGGLAAGAAGAPAAGWTNRRRFGVPPLTPDTTLPVERATRASETCPGLAAGFSASTSAAAPETWGAAVDVPDFSAVAVGERCPAERTRTPGA